MHSELVKLGHKDPYCRDGNWYGSYSGVNYVTSAKTLSVIHASAFRQWATANILGSDVLPIPALRSLGFTIKLGDSGVIATSPHGASGRLMHVERCPVSTVINYACNLERMAALDVCKPIGLHILVPVFPDEDSVVVRYGDEEHAMTCADFIARVATPHYIGRDSARMYVVPGTLTDDLFLSLKVDLDTRRIKARQRDDVELYTERLMVELAERVNRLSGETHLETAIKFILIDFLDKGFPIEEFPLLMRDLRDEFTVNLVTGGTT